MREELNASKVFSSMTVFDMLREQLHMVFFYVNQVVSGKVSIDRVNDFLHDVRYSLYSVPSAINFSLD